MRAAGVRVDLTIDESVPPLPEGLQLSIYRIVQEALTNVVKHARDASTTVRLTFPRDEVVIDVTNEAGPGEGRSGGLQDDPASLGADGGHGIIGPQPDGGFRVVARLSTRGAS